MINLYIIHVKFWQNYFIGKDRSSPMIIVKIKNVAFATFFFWCPKWDSNPHGFPHDFESFKLFYTYLFLVLNITF